MEITLTVHEEDGGFWSEITELPGCFASGGTLGELHEALADVVGLYLWDLPAEISVDRLGVGESRIDVRPAPTTAGPGG
jgi:predicted RNase H-like HicB family nuclease